jgi:hypothetical protein
MPGLPRDPEMPTLSPTVFRVGRGGFEFESER